LRRRGGPGLLERGRGPGRGLRRVLDAREGEEARRGGVGSRRDGSDADAELAAEPGLDVGRVALLAIGRLADELVEDLVDLSRERGLVVETAEGAEDLGQLGLLVARQVEP